MFSKGANKTLTKLSVVTIVLNDKEGFIKTFESLRRQTFTDFEHVVVDGGSTDGTVEFIQENLQYISKFVSEKDNGIYDAYNKGIRLSAGSFIWFLNAGDYLVGNVIRKEMLEAPCRIKVKFVNHFGRLQDYRRRNVRLSHPYNTQGIIYEKKGILFDTNFKIAADYQYYIDNGYIHLSLVETDGFVMYDNTGISTQMTALKYAECYEIILKNFGGIYAAQYFIRTRVKYFLKFFLSI